MCLLLLAGCSELSARSHARTGNEHFRRGDYREAVREYERAEQLAPDLAVAVFNRGLACRQLMVPGSKNDESVTECALSAFRRLQELTPSDPRGEQLYVQTLFDADRFAELAERYRGELARRPDDRLALNGIIQVYTRWQKPDDALHWLKERADRLRDDAEAQYAVGVFVFSQLLERGGGADKSGFDPRDSTAKPEDKPLFGVNDISGPARVALADRGIAYLEKALAIRPSYREALVYLNLLYRQKSFAYFHDPAAWQASIDAAERYRASAALADPTLRARAQ